MILSQEKAKTIYRKIKGHITLNEKMWLLSFRGDIQNYEKRLLKLAKKYNISVKEK